MWVRSLDQIDPLEKGMATHSSILARKIPWTEKPSRPRSMESQRDVTEATEHINTYIYIYMYLYMCVCVFNSSAAVLYILA